VPESPAEVDIIRQAILADRWCVGAERYPPGENDPRFVGLSETFGGQTIFQPEWSAHLVVHYAIGEHFDDGFFDLSITFHSRSAARQLAQLHIAAALISFRRPLFQCPWKGPLRDAFYCPWWILLLRAADPGLKLRNSGSTGIQHGALAMPLPRSFVKGDWDPIAPHVALIDPAQIELKDEHN
jgi:hypothetical protein